MLKEGDWMASYALEKKRLSDRLKRIEGQVRGVQKMIEDEVYCIDVLIQLASIKKATEKVSMLILDKHIKGCVISAVKEEGEDAAVEELMYVLDKFLKFNA